MSPESVAQILQHSDQLRPRMIQFLRELIAIPSPACGEEAVARRVSTEMRTLAFDAVEFDLLGNVVGTVGHGPLEILYDAHLDTINLGDVRSWDFDPFLGRIDDSHVYGLGASNNKGAMAAMVYGAHLLHRMGALEGITLRVVGSVMEEECEGLSYRSLLHSGLVQPDVIVLGKCTELAVCRGHRGRMELKGVVEGRSAHASTPEHGRNAAYTAATIIARIKELNENLPEDPFLGKGSVAVTHVESSRGHVFFTPATCEFHVDRRLTRGEGREEAIEQILRLAPGNDLKLEVLRYDRPSYTGQILEVERYHPQWEIPEDHAFLRAAVRAAAEVLDEAPVVKPWSFSTNGVYTMGVAGIPTLGFGPGRETQVHAINDRVAIDELTRCLRFYAIYPQSVRGMTGS